MKGITFGAYRSYEDFRLLLTSKEIGSPTPKTVKIDVQGGDGSLDLTDFFGEPKYEEVTHKFQFSIIVPQSEFLTLFSTIKNAIHGKKLRVSLDADPGFYYIGRCYVSAFTNEKSIGNVSIECECEPYRYKATETVVTQAVDGETVITLNNMKKRVVPLITIETETTLHIVYKQFNIWDLGSGLFTLPELELEAGENHVSVTGVGNISFTYQEAGL